MYDINKFVANERLATLDPEGHFLDLGHWSPLVAQRLAAAEGIELSEEHWQLIYCLRERYREQGPEWSARELTRELEHDFAEAGGRRRLYELFPRGPVAQGCRIAGLPLPRGATDASFGSVS